MPGVKSWTLYVLYYWATSPAPSLFSLFLTLRNRFWQFSKLMAKFINCLWGGIIKGILQTKLISFQQLKNIVSWVSKILSFCNQKESNLFLHFRFFLISRIQHWCLLMTFPLLVAIQGIIQLNKMKSSELCGSYKWLKGCWDRLMVLIVFSYWFLRWLYIIYRGRIWTCTWSSLKVT